MPRRIPIAIACVLAIAATIAGRSQSFLYLTVPPMPLAVWFPLVPLSGAVGIHMLVVSLFQFPLFAVAFAIGVRRCPITRVVLALALTYGLMVAIALAIVISDEKREGPHASSSLRATAGTM